MKEDFTVFTPEEKSLCELLVFYTSKKNWKKVIQIAIELVEMEAEKSND